MKVYLVYWLHKDGGGHVIVAVDETDVSNPLKYAVDRAMSKAQTICPSAQFFKLEELNLTKPGVLWLNEWYD